MTRDIVPASPAINLTVSIGKSGTAATVSATGLKIEVARPRFDGTRKDVSQAADWPEAKPDAGCLS